MATPCMHVCEVSGRIVIQATFMCSVQVGMVVSLSSRLFGGISMHVCVCERLVVVESSRCMIRNGWLDVVDH